MCHLKSLRKCRSFNVLTGLQERLTGLVQLEISKVTWRKPKKGVNAGQLQTTSNTIIVLSSSFDQDAPVAIRQRLLVFLTNFQLGVGQNDLHMDPKWVMSIPTFYVTSLDLWIHLDFNFDPFPIWGFSSQASVRSVGRAIRCLGNVVTWRPDVKTLKTLKSLNSGDFRTFLPSFYRFYQSLKTWWMCH